MVSLLNYNNDKVKIKNFINEFYDDKDGMKDFIYKDQMTQLKKRESQVIYINIDDIEGYDKDLAIVIENNGLRYQKLFCEVIDEILFEMGDIVVKDSFDTFLSHRIRMYQQMKNTNDINNGQNVQNRLTFEELKSTFPNELIRRYEAFFVARRAAKSMAVRNVLAANAGKLVKVKAIVTRVTQVKPLLKIATYSCDRCAAETYQEVLNQSFMPLIACMSESCKNESSKNAGRLHMISRSCKYVKMQELRVQEVCEQVPIGNIPRGMMVHCTGANTRLVQPGDNVYITGILLPSINSGPTFSQSLIAETYLDAHHINPISEMDSDDLIEIAEPTPAELDKIRDPATYNLMAKSIAPEIFGHEDIKKALLLMLSGGSKINPNGMKIRGTLNICLMGDPGVAKSQLLGFIGRLSPRSQHTTGRGCSGVGLTAYVVKDQLTGEFTLEGGSLVLADEGVCCIDEFDKMADSDRTAIHEVMEQQTISIAKAGIMTTLNARVSILAAANPAYGRYNPKRTIEQNIDLPSALLSRFDMMWLIQDKAERENDQRLAQHISYVHQETDTPRVVSDVTLFTMSELRRLLAIIRGLPDPKVPDSLIEYFVGVYVNVRHETRAATGKETLFTSPRTLLALLRIATSIARLNGRLEVDRSDADEAMRLLESSKASVRSNRDKIRRQAASYKDVIYQAIRAMGSRDIRVADVAEKCTSMGYTPDQLNEVIDCYEQLNVWQVNVGRTKISII